MTHEEAVEKALELMESNLPEEETLQELDKLPETAVAEARNLILSLVVKATND